MDKPLSQHIWYCVIIIHFFPQVSWSSEDRMLSLTFVSLADHRRSSERNSFKLFLNLRVFRSFSKVQICFNLPGFSRPITFNPVHNWPSRHSNACHSVMRPWLCEHPVIYLHTRSLPRERNKSASQKQWLATVRALDKLRLSLQPVYLVLPSSSLNLAEDHT